MTSCALSPVFPFVRRLRYPRCFLAVFLVAFSVGLAAVAAQNETEMGSTEVSAANASASIPRATTAAAEPKKPRRPASRRAALLHLVAAEDLYMFSDFGGAEKEARAAIRLGAGADAYAILGSALVRLERIQDAQEAFQRAIQIDPLNRRAILALQQGHALRPEP